MKYLRCAFILTLVSSVFGFDNVFIGTWKMDLDEMDKEDKILSKTVIISNEEIRIVMVNDDKNKTKMTIKIKLFAKGNETHANYLDKEITVILKETEKDVVTMDFGLGKVETLRK